MANKLLLFLTETRLHAWRTHGRELQDVGSFSLDDAGRDAFRQLVQRYRDDFYYLLTDLVEEEFKLDLVPHVNKRDQSKLIARKLEQLYRGTPYRAFMPQGRDSEGRRQDRVLFAAQANPGLLDGWIGLLTEGQARLAGIYSVALLLGQLAPKLLPQASNYLLVTRQADDGLRQTYITPTGLRFSRLTSTHAGNLAQQAETIVTESVRARQFLASTRGIGREEQMQVLVVTTEHDRPALEARCPATDLVAYRFVALSDAAARLGIALSDATDLSEQLLLRVLAAKAPANQYAPTEQRKYYRTWQTRLGLDIAAISAVVGGTVAASYLLWQGFALQQQTNLAAAKIAVAEATYQANALTAAQGEVTPEAMKNAVLAHREIVQGWPTINGDLDRLSLALDAFPTIQLEKINWGVRDRPDWGVDSVAAAPAAAPMPDGSMGEAKRYVVLIVSGRIADFSNQWGNSLTLVDALAAKLKARPDYIVTPLLRPFEPGSSQALKLDSAAEIKPENGAFTLRIAYPVGAPAA